MTSDVKEKINYIALPGVIDPKPYRNKLTVNEVASIMIEQILRTREVTPQQFHYKDPKIHGRGGGKGKGVGTTQSVTYCRHLYCYMMRLFFGFKLSLREIGQFIYEGLDHTTVLNGINQTKNRLFSGEITAAQIQELTKLIDNKIIEKCLLESRGMQAVEKTLLEKHLDIASQGNQVVSVTTLSLEQVPLIPKVVGKSASSLTLLER